MDYIQIEGFAKYGMLKEISETIEIEQYDFK